MATTVCLTDWVFREEFTTFGKVVATFYSPSVPTLLPLHYSADYSEYRSPRTLSSAAPELPVSKLFILLVLH